MDHHFLLQKDYKLHIPAVKEILNTVIIKEKFERLTDNFNQIYYSAHKAVNSKPDTKITDTLMSKILLGTLGCAPAYDRYFESAVKKRKSYNSSI